MIQKLQLSAGILVACSNLDTERALPRGWTHYFCGKDLPDSLRETESIQAGLGKNNCVVLAFFELSQARVDVPAQRENL